MSPHHLRPAAEAGVDTSLQALDATLGYGGQAVITGATVTIAPGEVVGLTGPSGSGKTTLGRAFAGLIAPMAGSVTLGGEAIETRRGRMSGRVAMLFQSPRRSCDPHLRLAEIIAQPLTVGRGARRGVRIAADEREQAVRGVARRVGLTDDLLGRLPREVSDGQLQRAALARALVSEPDHLVCDEATSMLDAATTASVIGVINGAVERGMGVLAISHDHELLHAWTPTVHDLAAVTTSIASRGEAVSDPVTPSVPVRLAG
ncbi:ABC transporter ATP-binding protein [Kribbia dieselivorans]|uniref:ABC transporter ATP-binding protein n=1 Tax=Kribbia dieselivorans TaxID=331526 RepID=UPI0009FA5811|nr:ATP-binding cassette domain-containing protein [Kribbia dieselivorans]